MYMKVTAVRSLRLLTAAPASVASSVLAMTCGLARMRSSSSMRLREMDGNDDVVGSAQNTRSVSDFHLGSKNNVDDYDAQKCHFLVLPRH